jgi:hypothetical protein
VLFKKNYIYIFEVILVTFLGVPILETITYVLCNFGALITLSIWAIIEEARHQSSKVYCCFVDFQKAFDFVS